ncbi:MAG: glycosyl hydrolase-related protein [Candidatus Marinimicrobia bacterium]|nr:glycosyl hydrolase-related protein [Candidatus Neomarinimicrobiota bacterium]
MQNIFIVFVYSFSKLLVSDEKTTRSDALSSMLDIFRFVPENFSIVLDFQVKWLDDYLTKFPEESREFAQMLASGRLTFGPWYVYPCSCLSNGETVIRNLLIGEKVGQKYGETLKIGISPLTSGLNSQLPQVYSGFNIDAVLVPESVIVPSISSNEFIWEGMDGIKLLASRYRQIKSNQFTQFISDYLCNSSENSGLANNFADSKTPGLTLIKLDETGMEIDEMKKNIRILIESVSDKKIQTKLNKYPWAIKESMKLEKLQIKRHELLDEATFHPHSGHNYPEKVRMMNQNFQLEQLILFYIEPWIEIGKQLNAPPVDVDMESTWCKLIEFQNMSQNVLSNDIEKIDDINSEYEQAVRLAKSTYELAIHSVLSRTEIRKKTGDEFFIAIVNTLAFPRSEIIEVTFEIPAINDKKAIEINDLSGRSVPCYVIEKKENSVTGPDGKRNLTRKYKCIIDVKNLPAMGFKILSIQPVLYPKTLHQTLISCEKNTLENDFMRVEINPNGTVTVFSKETAFSYENVGYFQYISNQKKQSVESMRTKITTEQLRPVIRQIYNCSLSAAFRIDYEWKPGTDAFGGTPIKFSNTIMLYQDSRFLHYEINFQTFPIGGDLQICFPTNFPVQTVFNNSRFAFESRKLRSNLNTGDENYYNRSFPMVSLVGLCNEEGGFSIFLNGLNRYKISSINKPILSIPLVTDYDESVGKRLKNDDLTVERGLKIKLAFFPHLGNLENGQYVRESMCYHVPLSYHQTEESFGTLPTKYQFLSIEPSDLVFIALKKSENEEGIVLRLMNPTDAHVHGKIVTYLPLRSVCQVNLKEQVMVNIQIENPNRFDIIVLPQKIVTIRIVFNFSDGNKIE